MAKIKRIEITNLKAISDLVADFNGCTAIITGGNNKGKTTLLRSIPDRIRGEKPELVLKHSEKEGKGILTLTTDERFEWEFDNTGKEKLIFVTKDGYKQAVTKQIANKFFPELFDIDVFLQASPKDQSLMLQKLVGVDFTDINSAYQLAFNERTLANRSLKASEARLSSFSEAIGTELKDESKLEQAIGGVNAHNDLFKRAKKQHGDNVDRLELLQNEVTALQKKIKEGEKWLEKNPLKNADTISTQLNEIKQHNEKVRGNINAKSSFDEYKALETKAKTADQQVKAIEKKKSEMIKSAKFPTGVELTDDQITVDGLPLDRNQISTSKLYCTALRLASLNLGDVRTLHFDASPLDKNTLREIEKWANDNDCQLLIERPDFDGGDIKYEIVK